MLRVTIEVVPGVGEPRVIGRGYIINDGTASDGSGDSPLGNYDYLFTGKGNLVLKDEGSGRVCNFPRRRLDAWHLLARCLREFGR